MQSKLFIGMGAVALVLNLGCSESGSEPVTGAGGSGAGSDGMGGMAAASGDDRLFVPEGLPSAELNGEGGLTLVALTLVQGQTSAELYAAVRNDGETPACEAGMLTDFIDKGEELVTTASSVLQSGRFYRINDGSNVIISCVAPGQVAMTAATNVPASVVIEELGSLSYTFPAFTVDVVPVDALTLSDVTTVNASGGTAYRGTVSNVFDATVTDTSVAIFPVNRVGRPLDVATGNATADLPPDGGWTFETTTVSDTGTGFVAFPDASFP